MGSLKEQTNKQRIEIWTKWKQNVLENVKRRNFIFP